MGEKGTESLSEINAPTCNGCTGAYVVFNFSNPGDKLFVRQLVPSGMSGGVGFCFTNGNCVTSYRSVADQTGVRFLSVCLPELLVLRRLPRL